MIGIIAVFLAVIWMLRNERDKTRPWLVFALVLNLFYGFLLSVVLGKENGLLPWKYDLFLFQLDASLGISIASIARPLQGFWRLPLYLIYQLMVPMMICWFLLTRYRCHRGSILLAYIAELVTGPIFYAILPACGPIYAFREKWLHPPLQSVHVLRFGGMPNAFPSLHVGTAMVFILFAPNKLWRGISVIFLATTMLATISTGEHYFIDLVVGLAFGCFAANVGYRRIRVGLLYLTVPLLWSFAIRFAYPLLVARTNLVRSGAALTVILVLLAVLREWRTLAKPAVSIRNSEDLVLTVHG